MDAVEVTPALAPPAPAPRVPAGPSMRGRLAGATAALLSGATVIAVARFFPDLDPLGSVPLLPLLGLGIAVGVGAYLAPKVEARSGLGSLLLGLGYGALVPAIVAATLTLPLPVVVPIAIGISPIAWPISIPSALGWLVLLRLDTTRQRLDRGRWAVLAAVAASLLLGWRFTQPLTTRSTSGEVCVSLAGETISAVAWSPNGAWLGFASRRGDTSMSISVMDAATGRFERLVSGHDVLGDFGFVVNDDGSIVYQVDFGGLDVIDATDPMAVELWTASSGKPQRLLGRVPDFGTLVAAAEGIAAVVGSEEDGEATDALWVRVQPAGIRLEPLTVAELARNPEVGLARGYRQPFAVQLGSVRHGVTWPDDATYNLWITPNHRWLLFGASGPTDGWDVTEQLVAQSVETGDRVVLREGPTWAAAVAGSRLAHLSYPDPENRLCVVGLRSSLT